MVLEIKMYIINNNNCIVELTDVLNVVRLEQVDQFDKEGHHLLGVK